jgi:hypothetical protein
MSQLTYQELSHYFAGVPEFKVKAFANGVQGKLVFTREYPIPHPDPDSDEAPDGTNHLRLEVITDGKSDWLPFDPDNIPKAKKGWCLLIHDLQLDKIHVFKVYDDSWQIHPMVTSLEELIAKSGSDKYQNETYQLIQL